MKAKEVKELHLGRVHFSRAWVRLHMALPKRYKIVQLGYSEDRDAITVMIQGPGCWPVYPGEPIPHDSEDSILEREKGWKENPPK